MTASTPSPPWDSYARTTRPRSIVRRAKELGCDLDAVIAYERATANRPHVIAALLAALDGDTPATSGGETADVVFALAEEGWQFVRTPAGLAAIEQSDDWPSAIATDEMRQRLAWRFKERFGAIASGSAITNALETLRGRALADPTLAVRDPQPRVARDHDDRVVLDLNDGTGRGAVLTSTGWAIAKAPPSTRVCFHRTAAMSALPEPDATAGPDALLAGLTALLNMRDADLRLIVGWLIAALLPEIAHPIVVLRGEQGTAKSTAASLLTRLLDPGPATLRKPPTERDPDSWIASASASWIVTLDNVSGVSPDVSDSLCRAVTGDATLKRALFTNNTAYVVAFRRPIVLTTIDASSFRGDLAERCIMIDLQPLGPRRVGEREIESTFAELHPSMLGGLLALASRVLDELQRTRLSHLPRMADFALILAALDTVMGWGNVTVADYVARVDSSALDALDAHAIGLDLRAYLDAHDSYTGTAAELLAALNARRGEGTPRPEGWPKTPSALSTALTRLAPGLRKLGWEYARKPRSAEARTLSITRIKET